LATVVPQARNGAENGERPVGDRRGRPFRCQRQSDSRPRAEQIERKLNSTDVIDVLSDFFILRGVRGHVHSDIRDTVQRVNSDAPVNILVDPIRDRLRTGGDVTFLALALAAWLRRVRGTDERGNPLIVTHPLAALLRE
jgi:hypothetical protein